MKIALGCDHGGLELKNEIVKHLVKLGHEVIDCGTYSTDSVHYPVFAFDVANKVKEKIVDKGIVVCTSGEGVMMCANKVQGVRCGMGYCDEVARLMVEHNNANVIAFGQKFMKTEDVLRRVDIFLASEFQHGRHQLRLDIIDEVEKETFKN